MNILKSISFFLLTVSVILVQLGVTAYSGENLIYGDQAKINEDLAVIKSTLSIAQNDYWLRSLDWTRYGNTVLYIFSTENDMVFVSDLIEWLLRGIQDWNVPNKDIRKFLSNTANRPDRSEVRLKLLNLLLTKATIEEYSKPEFTEFLFDPMPMIRRRMIQVIKESGTIEAIPELEKAIERLRSESTADGSILEELSLLKEAVSITQIWDKRMTTNWIPDDTEIRIQSERTLQLAAVGIYEDSPPPPWYLDGPRFIIDRWSRFKWGVKDVMESPDIGWPSKSALTEYILSRVHDQDWEEAFSMIMHYYHSIDEYRESEYDQSVSKSRIVNNILNRNSINDLHRLSQVLFSNDETDVRARGELLRKYAEIGTEDCLPELKQASVFWRNNNKPGTVHAIEKAILAIEQRLGMTPSVNPVHPTD